VAELEKSRKRVEKLKEILRGKPTLLIVLQDFPDPDAIGSAAALRELANKLTGTQCSIAHGGVVGRGENRAMVRYLGLKLRPIEELDPRRFSLIAMVDTQPGTGNNSLPPEFFPHIVIDHHRIRPQTRKAPFTDIRSHYGAVCTILYEYLRVADIPIEPPVATALAYGIRSDTQDLGRESTQADIEAFLELYPLANKRMLSVIENGCVPRAYFRALARALLSARLYGRCVVSALGEVESADILGEAADLLLRNEESDWALCYGYFGGKLWLSLRTNKQSANAGVVMRRIVGRKGTGGGHNATAGGQIPVDNTKRARALVEKKVVERFLKAAGEPERQGEPLVPPPQETAAT